MLHESDDLLSPSVLGKKAARRIHCARSPLITRNARVPSPGSRALGPLDADAASDADAIPDRHADRLSNQRAAAELARALERQCLSRQHPTRECLSAEPPNPFASTPPPASRPGRPRLRPSPSTIGAPEACTSPVLPPSTTTGGGHPSTAGPSDPVQQGGAQTPNRHPEFCRTPAATPAKILQVPITASRVEPAAQSADVHHLLSERNRCLKQPLGLRRLLQPRAAQLTDWLQTLRRATLRSKLTGDVVAAPALMQASVAAEAHFQSQVRGSPGLLDSAELTALTAPRTAEPTQSPATACSARAVQAEAPLAAVLPAAGMPSPLMRQRQQQRAAQLLAQQSLPVAQQQHLQQHGEKDAQQAPSPPLCPEQSAAPDVASPLPVQSSPQPGAAPQCGTIRGAAVRGSLAVMAAAESRRLSSTQAAAAATTSTGATRGAPPQSPLQQSLAAGSHLEAAIRASPGLLTDSELQQLGCARHGQPQQQEHAAPRKDSRRAAASPVHAAKQRPSQSPAPAPEAQQQQQRPSCIPAPGSKPRPLADRRSATGAPDKAPGTSARPRGGGLPRVATLQPKSTPAALAAPTSSRPQRSAPASRPPGADEVGFHHACRPEYVVLRPSSRAIERNRRINMQC